MVFLHFSPEAIEKKALDPICNKRATLDQLLCSSCSHQCYLRIFKQVYGNVIEFMLNNPYLLEYICRLFCHDKFEEMVALNKELWKQTNHIINITPAYANIEACYFITVTLGILCTWSYFFVYVNFFLNLRILHLLYLHNQDFQIS